MHHVNNVCVVMVPLPAQGHLNQLLHLARIISTRGLPVHFIGSSTHNRQAKDRLHGWNVSTVSNIYFHDFEIPYFITPPANPNASNKFPSHLVPTFEAYVNLREPLGVLIHGLASSSRRVVVLHDSLMAFAAKEAASLSNAEAYSFVSVSAFAVLSFIRLTVGDKALIHGDIPCVSFEDISSESFEQFSTQNIQWLNYCSGDIYNSCYAIEGRFFDVMADLQKDKRVWAIGPFHPLEVEPSGGSRHYCLEWLNKQPPNSVIYVSFGTMTSISDEQITELAIGLERSGQRFIWALRDADRGDIYNGEIRRPQLPDGFEGRIKAVGLIVRDWAPQLLILAHNSTGGFMSHCGWNSTIESLSMGVPVAAWPMHSDQPYNAFLITEVLKAGLTVREWSHRKELVCAHDIENSITKLMALEDGSVMRMNAKNIGISVRQDVSENGLSTTQLECLLSHISR